MSVNWRGWLGRRVFGLQPHADREALLAQFNAGKIIGRAEGKKEAQLPPIFGEKIIHLPMLPSPVCLSCPHAGAASLIPIASPYPQNPGLAQALDLRVEPPTFNELQASNDAFVQRNQAYGATLPTSHETPIVRLGHIKRIERGQA